MTKWTQMFFYNQMYVIAYYVFELLINSVLIYSEICVVSQMKPCKTCISISDWV